ncbi:MAG: hypothetical protein QM783_01640 [Phycisphaerales bacterium]
MLAALEDLAVVDADALEDAVAVEEAMVVDADHGLVLGDHAAVDVDPRLLGGDLAGLEEVGGLVRQHALFLRSRLCGRLGGGLRGDFGGAVLLACPLPLVVVLATVFFAGAVLTRMCLSPKRGRPSECAADIGSIVDALEMRFCGRNT